MKRSLVVSVLSVTLAVAGCSNKKSQPAPTAESSSQSQPVPAPEAAPEPLPPVAPPAPPSRSSKQSTPKSDLGSTAPAKSPLPVAKIPEPPKPIVIPAGTVINVRLQQAVSSKTSQVGDTFAANLSEPISVGGETVAPAGTEAGGTITNAKAAGKFKGGAALHLKLDTLVIGGTRYQVATEEIAQTSKGKGKRSATMIGGGAGAGALIGGLAGGGKGAAIGALVGGGAGTAGAALTGNNNDISLPAESAVSFKLTAPLTLKSAQPNPRASE
jgi:hypothetical protein